MPADPRKPTDGRRYRDRTERHLLVAAVVLLAVVGSAMIGLVYGWPSIFTALLCLLPAAMLIGLLWLFLNGIDRLTR